MNNSPVMIIGILLVVIGVAVLGWQGITYTTRETVVDIGPVKVTAEKEKELPLPPIIGGAALACGLALILTNRKKT